MGKDWTYFGLLVVILGFSASMIYSFMEWKSRYSEINIGVTAENNRRFVGGKNIIQAGFGNTGDNKIFKTEEQELLNKPEIQEMLKSLNSKLKIENNNVQLHENPSDEDIKGYLREVENKAISTNYIAIDGCVPEPTIIKTSVNSKIKFVNNDSVSKKILIQDPGFVVPSESSYDIETNFSSGTGIYNYDCDEHFSVGTIWVVE